MAIYMTVQGNLTGEPIGRTVANGAAMVTFRIASNSRRFDKETGEYRDVDTTYIGVTCWRTLAGNVLASLRKGDSVIVFGKFIQRDYETKEGEPRTVYEIDALAVGPDLNRWPADLRRPSRQPEVAAPEAAAPAEVTDAPQAA
jgi:single-strand DNA-binding protein